MTEDKLGKAPIMIAVSTDSRVVVPPIDRAYPRLWISSARLAFLKDAYHRHDALFANALEHMISIADCALSETSAAYVGDDSAAWRESMNADGKRAVCLAIAYHMTGQKHYVERAVESLLKQQRAMPEPLKVLSEKTRFPNLGLDAVCGSSGLILAYDLLRSESEIVLPSVVNSMDAWLRELVGVIRTAMARWENNQYFGGQDFQNHLGEHMMGLAQIGMVLGDRDLVQFALDSDENPRDLKTMIDGAIHIAGDKPEHHHPPQTGEMFDRYRTTEGAGFGYAFHALRMLLLTAELAYRLGIDFYRYEGLDGERLDLPLHFYREFVLTGDNSLKGGYYQNSKIPAGKYGEFYELGMLRYPEHAESFSAVLTSQHYARTAPDLYPVHQPTLSWLITFGNAPNDSPPFSPDRIKNDHQTLLEANRPEDVGKLEATVSGDMIA